MKNFFLFLNVKAGGDLTTHICVGGVPEVKDNTHKWEKKSEKMFESGLLNKQLISLFLCLFYGVSTLFGSFKAELSHFDKSWYISRFSFL